MLPGKQHIADSCPVAVDAQEPEGEGDLGDPRAPSLNQQVDENQAEGSQQGEQRPVFGARRAPQRETGGQRGEENVMLLTIRRGNDE